MNCLNLVNDGDISACKKAEYENYFNIMRKEYFSIKKELEQYRKREEKIWKLAEIS